MIYNYTGYLWSKGLSLDHKYPVWIKPFFRGFETHHPHFCPHANRFNISIYIIIVASRTEHSHAIFSSEC